MEEIEFTLSTGDVWLLVFPPGMGWTCSLQPLRIAAAELAPARGVAVRLAMLKGKGSEPSEAWRRLLRRHAGSYPVAAGADYEAEGDGAKALWAVWMKDEIML